MVCALRIILLFTLVELSIAAIFNGSFLEELDSIVKTPKPKKSLLGGRRQNVKRNGRSTSSSSGAQETDGGHERRDSSLALSEEFTSSSYDEKKPHKNKRTTKKSYKPQSSKERKGWKKWHRKCQQCPEDMNLKWRDPSIKWICGSYQRARRSFKSACMMHYRNCQDGTMFTKIAEHRCQNETKDNNHGEHFFYDYKVVISGDTSKDDSKGSSDESVSSKSSSSSSSSWSSDKLERNEINALNGRA